MKDIPVEELAAISPEIHADAVRVGCTAVSITGKIWPGGRLSGPAEKAARFVEYSWLRAAVVNGRPVFEEEDAKAFAGLLAEYGLEEAPAVEQVAPAGARARLEVDVAAETMAELERQAAGEGIGVGAYLDWKFRPR